MILRSIRSALPGLLGVAVLASSSARPQEAAAAGPAEVRGARSGAGGVRDRDSLVWDERAAEHLLNRAAFGAGRAEVERAVAQGLDAAVDELLTGRGASEPFFVDAPERPTRLEKKDYTAEQRRELRNRLRREDRALLDRFADWWLDEMVSGPDPLRERMTLFWHGHFTSSYRETKEGQALISQNELFRAHALGSFEELLRAVLRDPAMLLYLDNDQNTRNQPNENLARELLELFTLGEGHYEEQDVREAARALTGWGVRAPAGSDEPGFTEVFRPGRHDKGKKRVLGVRGRLDVDGLVDAILKRKDCSRWVAGRLLQHFEGRAARGRRLERYAALLRDADWQVAPFLRSLFTDPEFYSDEVVGTRIAGPVEYLVGAARRLRIEPPGRLLWISAAQLGQRLFDPPSVDGWEGGRTWVTTSSFLQRGNVIGLLLGVTSMDDVLAAEPGIGGADPAMDAMMDTAEAGMDPSFEMSRKLQGRELSGMRRVLERGEWWPRIHLSARCREREARFDLQIVELFCDELLAVEATGASRAALASFLEGQRGELGVQDGALLDAGPRSEHVLRRLAHLVLSLPEAHLN